MKKCWVLKISIHSARHFFTHCEWVYAFQKFNSCQGHLEVFVERKEVGLILTGNHNIIFEYANSYHFTWKELLAWFQDTSIYSSWTNIFRMRLLDSSWIKLLFGLFCYSAAKSARSYWTGLEYWKAYLIPGQGLEWSWGFKLVVTFWNKLCENNCTLKREERDHLILLRWILGLLEPKNGRFSFVW